MNYTLVDIGRLLLAVGLLAPVLVLPGVAIASLTNLLGYRDAPPERRWLVALVAAFALLPWLVSTLAKFGGLAAALAVALALAAYGLAAVVRPGRPPALGRARIVSALAWLALVVLTWVDFEWRGALYQSALIFDTVKHAATVQVIADSGLPHADPFFARSEPASYYYYFYVPAALALKLSGGLIDARAGMGGLVFWCGIALFGLVTLVFERCRFAPSAANTPAVLLALLAVAGLDIVPLMAAAAVGIWYPSMDWWNEQLTSWLPSVLWVPHHLTGLMACWLGFMIVAEEVERAGHGERRPSRLAIFLAGMAFATALGSSVWVTFGGVATAGLWLVLLCWERRWRVAGFLLASGACGVLLATPFILELLGSRSYDGMPITLTVRPFTVWDTLAPPGAMQFLGRALLLPVNYGLELGAFVLGSILFWRGYPRADVHRVELARVVTLGAIAGFLIGTFGELTIIGNDLGWRAVLFLQLATLFWTAAYICERVAAAAVEPSGKGSLQRIPALLGTLLMVGCAGTAWGVLALRLYVVPGAHSANYLGIDPKASHALRGAYAWLNEHAPLAAITQHDPTPNRSFDFGLYGRNPVAVADKDGNLFGAERAAVARRVASLGPIFRGLLAPSEVRARAAAHRVDFLVVSRADPIWRSPDSWLWRVTPVFANQGARVIAVRTLAEGEL